MKNWTSERIKSQSRADKAFAEAKTNNMTYFYVNREIGTKRWYIQAESIYKNFGSICRLSGYEYDILSAKDYERVDGGKAIIDYVRKRKK